jgi:hypothetical protein
MPLDTSGRVLEVHARNQVTSESEHVHDLALRHDGARKISHDLTGRDRDRAVGSMVDRMDD